MDVGVDVSVGNRVDDGTDVGVSVGNGVDGGLGVGVSLENGGGVRVTRRSRSNVATIAKTSVAVIRLNSTHTHHGAVPIPGVGLSLSRAPCGSYGANCVRGNLPVSS